MTDPIADMLTQIRNAYLAKHQQVSLPLSNLKHQLALKLQTLGYIESVSINSDAQPKELVMGLKYQNKIPIVTTIKRVSKPGRRVYSKSNQIKSILSGYGTTILSTSSGILTDKEAKAKGLGGEVICQIW